MHGRLRVSSRLIYASSASLGIVLGLIFVFHARGLAGAANLAQLISLIPVFGIIFGGAWRRKDPSESSAARDDSGQAKSAAASSEEPDEKDAKAAQGPAGSTPHQADLRRRLDGKFVVPAAFVMCAVFASSVAIIAHFGFSARPVVHVPSKGSSLPNGLTVQSNLALTKANYCEGRFGTHPMPLAAVNPPAFFIDNRCVVPVDADPSDPTMDGPTNLRSGTDYSDTHVTALKDGDKVLPLCWTFGKNLGITLGVTPPIYDVSPLWLKVRAPDGKIGYLPDVYTGGGGYSERQLVGLGIRRCG